MRPHVSRSASAALLLGVVVTACGAFDASETEGSSGGGGETAVVKDGAIAKGLAASGGTVAWTQDDGLWIRVGDKAPYFATKPIDPGAMRGPVVVQGGEVYFANGSSTPRCSVTGAPCKAEITGPGQNFIVAIAARGSELLYVNENGVGETLFSCTLPYCSKPVEVVELGGNPVRMAATPVSVVFALSVAQKNASIVKYTGTDASTIAGEIQVVTGMAVDASTVYWTDGGRGTVSACSLADCAGGPKVLAAGRPLPAEVAVDGTRLYWIEGLEQPDGQVMRCTLPACSDAAPLAAVAKPKLLAVGDRVYVATDSKILSVTK